MPWGHGRVRQRAGAQPRAAASAGARLGQGARGGDAVRAGTQPDAHGQDRAAVDRSGHRCVLNGRSGRLGSARGEKSPRIGPGKTPEGPSWHFKRRRLASRRLHRHARRAQRSQRCKSNASRSLRPRHACRVPTAASPGCGSCEPLISCSGLRASALWWDERHYVPVIEPHAA
jgi:hypothetical protein